MVGKKFKAVVAYLLCFKIRSSLPIIFVQDFYLQQRRNLNVVHKDCQQSTFFFIVFIIKCSSSVDIIPFNITKQRFNKSF